MPKIKPIELDDDIFDKFIESINDSKSKKKKKKKKKVKKKKKKGKDKKKSKKKKKLHKKKKVKGYIGDSEETALSLYSHQYNKSIVSRIFDKFNINLDSKVDVSVSDETMATIIGIGASIIKSFMTKRK